MADNYSASTARDAYYPADSNQIARVHAREKTLHDMADYGLAEFFEGTGDNPTGLTGYSTEKLWLRQTGAGVTTTPGTIRYYNGGDATQLANWPVITKAGAMAHMGVRGADLDFVWSASTAGDPGSGKIAVNNATIASATTISISKTGRVGQSYGTTLSGIIANGARFLIYQVGTQTAYLNITTTGAGTDNSTYVTFPISVTTSSTLTAGALLGVAYQSSQLPANSLNNLITYDTKAAADAALSGLANGQVIKILADETRSNGRTIYKKTAGAYVYQRPQSMRLARAEMGLAPIEGLRACQAKFKAVHQGTITQIRCVTHGDSVAGDAWNYLGPAINAAIDGPACTYPVNDDAGDVSAVLVKNLGFPCTATGTVTNLTTATDVWPNGAVMRAAVGTTSFKQGPFDPTWSAFKLGWKKGPGQGDFDLVVGGVTVASYSAAAASVSLGVHSLTQVHATTAVQVVVTSGTVDFVVATGCDTRTNGLWNLAASTAGQTLLSQMTHADARKLYSDFIVDFAPTIVTFNMKEVDNVDYPGSLVTFFNLLDTACPLADKLIFTPNPYTDEATPGNETAMIVQNGQLLDAVLLRDDSYLFFDSHAPYGNNARVDSYGLMGEPDDIHALAAGSLHAMHLMLDALGIGRHPWHKIMNAVNNVWSASRLASGTTFGKFGNYFSTVPKWLTLSEDDVNALDWTLQIGRRLRVLDYAGTILLRVSNTAAAAYNSMVAGILTSNADNVSTLGSSSLRWTTVYATNATINTSDEREKQDIAPIDDAVLRAWARVEWVQYRWINDPAKLHFGLIAQRVVAAFAAEGIDALAMGLVTYDEWDEERDGDRVIVAAGNRYGMNYTAANAIEAEYQRRRIAALETRMAA